MKSMPQAFLNANSSNRISEAASRVRNFDSNRLVCRQTFGVQVGLPQRQDWKRQIHLDLFNASLYAQAIEVIIYSTRVAR